MIKYPDYLINDQMNKITKDKKKYNYRRKAKNYMIEDNILYFTGFAGKNNTKLSIPFEKDKIDILKKTPNNNGHLGINRTYNKIKEIGYYLENIIDDVKNYIKNCPNCILAKAGKTINTKSKVIITKGLLEREWL